MSTYDGTNQKITAAVEPGTVVRSLNDDGTTTPFSDSVVLELKDGYYKLARPYVFGSGVTGCEVHQVSRESLERRFVMVMTARGAPYKM